MPRRKLKAGISASGNFHGSWKRNTRLPQATRPPWPQCGPVHSIGFPFMKCIRMSALWPLLLCPLPLSAGISTTGNGRSTNATSPSTASIRHQTAALPITPRRMCRSFRQLFLTYLLKDIVPGTSPWLSDIPDLQTDTVLHIKWDSRKMSLCLSPLESVVRRWKSLTGG